MTQNGDFSIFDNEEKVIKQAENLASNFDEHAKLVHENMKSLALGYRRSFREQQRLIRLSDRQQEQLRNMTVELQCANDRLEDQAKILAELNAALQDEIKQKKILEDELRVIATVDSLTGVYTRRQLFEFGENEFKRFLRTAHPLSVLMIDIDHFKTINDTYGHGVGDCALQSFTAICKESIRTADILGRVGGEEFVVIMPETQIEDGVYVAERIRKNVAESKFCVEDLSITITVSIGLRSVDAEDGSFERSIAKADSALYEAKRGGRNSVVVYKEVS